MAYPGLGSFRSQITVVATTDNTTVTITPIATQYLQYGTNAYTFVMQQGQTYQVADSSYSNDITGARVRSDKPIGMFAGASLAFVPPDTSAGNPLVQEQMPVDSWGTETLSVGFAGRRNGDSYRVLAAYDNTVISTNGVVAGTNQAGEFLDMIIAGPVEFQGNRAMQVAHFANGATFDNATNIKGDPCLILLLPVGCWLETNVVFTLTNDVSQVTGDFDENFVNLIVSQSGTNSTRVDGSLVATTNYMAIRTSGFYGAQITITNSGAHVITSSQPVGVEVYGWGYWDAYGYFGGIVK